MKSLIFVILALMPLADFALAGEQSPDQQLVTVTGQQDPKFSVPVNSEDMQKVADGLQGLSDLPTVTVDVNDLFHPGDEEVIKSAAKDISNKFVTASMILIDLRTIIYKLSSLLSVYPNGKDKDTLKKTYAETFSQRYIELLSLFVQTDDTMNAAINSCKSELCTENIAQAQRQIFAFGKAMNNREDYDPTGYSAKLFRGSIEETYQQMSVILDKTQSSYNTTSKAVMASLVSSNREKTSMKNVLDSIVGSKEDLEKIGITIPALPKRLLVTESEGLDTTVSNKLAYLASGGKSAPEQRLGYFYTHVLSCWTNGSYSHVVGYGKAEFTCTSSRNPNVRFEGSLKTYGPGLAIIGTRDGYKLNIFIASPALINEVGTWTGVTVKAGVGAAAGDLAHLFGKHGSVAAVVGGNLGGLAIAGVETLTISQEKK